MLCPGQPSSASHNMIPSVTTLLNPTLPQPAPHHPTLPPPNPAFPLPILPHPAPPLPTPAPTASRPTSHLRPARAPRSADSRASPSLTSPGPDSAGFVSQNLIRDNPISVRSSRTIRARDETHCSQADDVSRVDSLRGFSCVAVASGTAARPVWAELVQAVFTLGNAQSFFDVSVKI